LICFVPCDALGTLPSLSSVIPTTLLDLIDSVGRHVRRRLRDIEDFRNQRGIPLESQTLALTDVSSVILGAKGLIGLAMFPVNSNAQSYDLDM
jgi:hypothetical protein